MKSLTLSPAASARTRTTRLSLGLYLQDALHYALAACVGGVHGGRESTFGAAGRDNREHPTRSGAYVDAVNEARRAGWSAKAPGGKNLGERAGRLVEALLAYGERELGLNAYTSNLLEDEMANESDETVYVIAPSADFRLVERFIKGDRFMADIRYVESFEVAVEQSSAPPAGEESEIVVFLPRAPAKKPAHRAPKPAPAPEPVCCPGCRASEPQDCDCPAPAWTEAELAEPGGFSTVAEALSAQGLRVASAGAGEPGWYVRVLVRGEAFSVWATDLPAPSAP